MTDDVSTIIRFFQEFAENDDRCCSIDDPEEDSERMIRCIEHYARSDVNDLRAHLYNYGADDFFWTLGPFLHRDAFIFLGHNPVGLRYYVRCLFEWSLRIQSRDQLDSIVEAFMMWWYRSPLRQFEAVHDENLRVALENHLSDGGDADEDEDEEEEFEEGWD